MDQSVKRNAGLLYLLNFLIGFIFWYGIEKAFLFDQLHLPVVTIAYMITTYGIVQILLNVPTGALADRWSRKGVLSLSLVCFFIGTAILGMSNSLWGYLLGTLFWSFYLVMMTGTHEALLYDGMKQLGTEKGYKKIYGRTQAIFMFGIFCSSFVSGFIAHKFGLRSAYFLSLVPILLAFLLSLFVVEPTVHKKLEEKSALRHMRSSLSTIKHSKALIQIVLMSLVFFLIQISFYEYAQLFYLAIFSGSVIAIGILNGSGGLSIGLGNLASKYLHFKGLGFLLIGTFLILSCLPFPSLVRAVLFMGYAFVFGISNANINEFKHSFIPSHMRATLSSTIGMTDYMVVIPMALLFSKLITATSIFWAFGSVGLLAIVYFCFYHFKARHIFETSTVVES